MSGVDKVSQVIKRMQLWPTRRKLLAGLFGAGAAGILGGGLSFGLNTPEGLVVRAIRRLLPEIEIDTAELEAYAKDFVARDHYTSAARMAGLRVAAPILNSPAFRWMIPGRVGDLLDSYDRRALTGFLMSTDFFEVRNAGGTRVSYTGFFDPYEKTCGNPLALMSAET